MGICLSSSGTLHAIDELGQEHDAKVIEWRDALLPYVSTSQVNIYTFYNNYYYFG